MAATERVARSYLFDLGNSVDGPIGACIRIEALTAEEALARVRECLREEVEIDDVLAGRLSGTEYATVYFNPLKITLDDLSGEAECVACESVILEDQDRCPYEHEHPTGA